MKSKPFLFAVMILVAASCQRAKNSPQPQLNQNAQLPSCGRGELSARASWQGASGALVGTIVFTNITAVTCAVQGVPQVDLYSGDVKLPVEEQTFSSSTRSSSLTLHNNEQAAVQFSWHNWCGGPCQAPITLQVTVPGNPNPISATVTNQTGNPAADVPRCDNASQPSTLVVSPFTAYTGTPAQPANTSSPVGASSTSVSALTPNVPTTTPLILGMEKNGQTLQAGVGDEFLLSLDNNFNWFVNVSDQSVLSRLVSAKINKSAQGLYQTHDAGTAIITARGEPVCFPRCKQPASSQLYRVTIMVK